jgi:branched-chain amino acid transport system substrate-binding protein
VSSGGTGAGSRSGLGLHSLRSGEALRLTIAVVLAAGAVALGEYLTGGGHGSHAAAGRSGQGSLAARGSGGAGKGTAGSGSAGQVTVAGGAAVTRSLQHGQMTVVIDQPPPGLFSEQNRSIAHGAAVAVDELNGAGGLARHIHVKLVSQSLDGLSAAALQRQLSSEAAAVLILPCDTDSQLSLAAAASQYGILMLAPCNPDASAGGRYATYWPVGTAATEEAAGLASFLHSLGYGRIFIVSAPGSRYVELVTSDFQSAAQSSGMQIAGSASIATTTTDFSGLARTINAASPRPAAIFTALPPPLVNRLAAGLQAQGVDQAVLGSSVMDTPLTVSTRPKKTLENATFSSYGFPRTSASAHRFAAEYQARFGSEPVGSFPGLGLETIRLLEDAVRKAGSAEPPAIQRALAGGITLKGVGLADRTYQPAGDHNPIGEVAISKVSAGSILPLFATTPSSSSTP